MIILGDVGINYFGDERDVALKEHLSTLPINLFCIHGNHENRVTNILTYKKFEYLGGIAYYEPDYPNLIFAKDGEVYTFNDRKYIIIGGAYSVDKDYRVAYGYRWWEDEQPSNEIKEYVTAKLDSLNWNIHGFLSHTSPLKYEPIEVFIAGVDQSSVDKSTEIFLDEIDDRLNYNVWYCGHYHTEKKIDKMRFLFGGIEELK